MKLDEVISKTWSSFENPCLVLQFEIQERVSKDWSFSLDPYNMELRASILTGVLQPEKIAIMEEKEFYSKPKKEIVEKK